MNFRQLLLLFSLIMIGFILTLYFQTESTVQSMNFEQYKSLQYNESRSHSLEDFNKEISPFRLEDLISEIFERNRLAGQKTRIMEVGFGNGRVLMELKKKFPDIEFYGINKEKTHTFYRRESFVLTALKFEIMTKDETDAMVLPYVVFQDIDYGQRIPYDENKFDLIYSHFTGVNIFSKGVLLPMNEAMREIRRRGIEIYMLDNPKSIRFKKPEFNVLFPLTPHQPVPKQLDNLSHDLRRPEMSYNLNP